MDQMQADAGRSTRLPPDVNPVSEVVNTAMRAATTLNRNLLDNFAAYQKEWLGFLNRRWRENLDVPTRLASCRTLPEVQQVYLDYWKRAAEQYGVEFRHLGEIAQTKLEPAKPQQGPSPAVAPTKASRPVTPPAQHQPAA